MRTVELWMVVSCGEVRVQEGTLSQALTTSGRREGKHVSAEQAVL